MSAGKSSLLLGTAVLALLFGSASLPADDLADADTQVLKDASLATDGPALLAFLAKQSLTEDQLRAAEGLVRKLGSDSYEQREQATGKLIALGRPVQSLLKKAQTDRDPEVARRAEYCQQEIDKGPGSSVFAAAVRAVARARPDGALAALLRYAAFVPDDVVEDEVLAALVAVATASDEDARQLTQALKSPLPARRAAAAFVLGRAADRRAAVRLLLTDPEPRVRLRAVEGLLAGRDREAVPVLLALLEGSSEDIAGRALDLLERLGGEQSPTVGMGDYSPAAQRKLREAWAAWWKEHAESVDLARLDDRPPYLGRILVAQVDSHMVFEIDRSGKRVWELEISGGPIEAQLLPGGRLLVAENQGSMVTERDLHGKLLWHLNVEEPVLSCQRLPGGNTFVATNWTIAEYTPAGKAVYLRKPVKNNVRINSALRLRNGHVALISDAAATLDELDPRNGEVLRSLKLPCSADCYGLEEVRGGHFLIASYGSGKVVELDADGKTVWEHGLAAAFHATRLPNGNYLLTSHSLGLVQEISPDHKVVREFKAGAAVWRAHAR